MMCGGIFERVKSLRFSVTRAPAPPTTPGGNDVFVVGIGQAEGAFKWLPVFDQRVVERGCHLVNQVTCPRGRNIRLFAPVH